MKLRLDHVLWTLLGIVVIVAFDRAMTIDKARLCSTDATAYEGC